MRMRYFWSC